MAIALKLNSRPTRRALVIQRRGRPRLLRPGFALKVIEPAFWGKAAAITQQRHFICAGAVHGGPSERKRQREDTGGKVPLLSLGRAGVRRSLARRTTIAHRGLNGEPNPRAAGRR